VVIVVASSLLRLWLVVVYGLWLVLVSRCVL